MRRITRTIQHLIAGSLASQRVARANAAKASVKGRWVLRHADQDAGQDDLHNDSRHNSQGSVMVPSPRDTPTTGTAAEVDPEPQAAAAVVVTVTVASTSEGAR
jgi:hypothetical protein